MKLKLLIPLLIALLLGLVLVGNRACNLYDENSVLRGRDEILTGQLSGALESLRLFEENNRELLAELKRKEEATTEVIDEYVKAAEKISGTLRTVGELRANAENDKALIAEMEIEIVKRDEIIDKLVFTIQKQEERYFVLGRQYTIIKKELDLSKIALEQYRGVVEVKDLRIKGLEKSVKKLKFSSDIKSGIVVGLAAAVAYGLLK